MPPGTYVWGFKEQRRQGCAASGCHTAVVHGTLSGAPLHGWEAGGETTAASLLPMRIHGRDIEMEFPGSLILLVRFGRCRASRLMAAFGHATRKNSP